MKEESTLLSHWEQLEEIFNQKKVDQERIDFFRIMFMAGACAHGKCLVENSSNDDPQSLFRALQSLEKQIEV